MKPKHFILLFVVLFVVMGWGGSGHKIINRRVPLSFPSQMNYFNSWTDSLQRHASDADNRKNQDSTESRKHYIDIDEYQEFILTGRIPQTLDSLYMIHGWNFVIDNGIVPFAIPAITDSIKKCFQRRDFQKAMLHSADLGHYVADAHNPLHLTRNYDGQYTNQTGVHSRYESQLINRDSAEIIYGGDSITYINDVQSYAFNLVYQNYIYLDSVLKYDSIAHSMANNTYGTLYYQYYWAFAKNFTIYLFKKASKSIASLIYTAWINAGSPLPTWIKPKDENISSFRLEQNYPNPFNPSTNIRYSIPKNALVKITVFDLLGREVQVLVNKSQSAGTYETTFNSSNYSSGIYLYQLNVDGKIIDSKKMSYIK